MERIFQRHLTSGFFISAVYNVSIKYGGIPIPGSPFIVYEISESCQEILKEKNKSEELATSSYDTSYKPDRIDGKGAGRFKESRENLPNTIAAYGIGLENLIVSKPAEFTIKKTISCPRKPVVKIEGPERVSAYYNDNKNGSYSVTYLAIKEGNILFDLLHLTGLFLHPLKTSENLKFSDVFRRYRNRL